MEWTQRESRSAHGALSELLCRQAGVTMGSGEYRKRNGAVRLSHNNAFLTKKFCIAIGYPGTVKEFSRPFRSAIPSLLITGALDATNPVENARDVAAGLRNAVMLEVANTAHEALPVPAVQDVIVDFLRATDVRNRQVGSTRPHYLTVTESLLPPQRRGPP